MIKVRESAKAEVQRLLTKSGAGEQAFIRVGVKGGGCSGLMYDLISTLIDKKEIKSLKTTVSK
jgi:iron-sulfur cluster assembly protein